jgi:hypothetical protein
VLSSSHSVETVDVLSTTIVAIDEEVVRFHIKGEIEVEFHWVPSRDGIDGDESFPFELTMWSFVDDLKRFEDIEVTVDASSWHAGFYDDSD